MTKKFEWDSTSLVQLREVLDDVEKDPFKYLLVSPDDSIEHIKRMYRKLATKYHPDRHSRFQLEDPVLCYERMVIINRAYEAIQRIKGNKVRWEMAHYDPWTRDESNFEGIPGKEIIALESFDGELYRSTKEFDLQKHLPSGISDIDLSETRLGKVFYHSFSVPQLTLGEPDEPFMFGFGQSINLMQLFVFLARKQGISLAPVVVKPLLEFHKLHEMIDAKEFADAVTSVSVSEKGLRSLIKRFGIDKILKSRGPNAPTIGDFMDDLSRIVDMTQFWDPDYNRFEKYHIYGAGIKDDGGFVIYCGWGGMDKSEFTKNDFELMVRLTYGYNLLPFSPGDEHTSTYDIRKFGSEEALEDAIKTFRKQELRLRRRQKRLKGDY
jgi:hypothetical protein